MQGLDNPRNVSNGDRVEFEYNGRTRSGTVERVGKTFLTLKHDKPEMFDGKDYSTYKFIRLGSRIRLV